VTKIIFGSSSSGSVCSLLKDYLVKFVYDFISFYRSYWKFILSTSVHFCHKYSWKIASRSFHNLMCVLPHFSQSTGFQLATCLTQVSWLGNGKSQTELLEKRPWTYFDAADVISQSWLLIVSSFQNQRQTGGSSSSINRKGRSPVTNKNGLCLANCATAKLRVARTFAAVFATHTNTILRNSKISKMWFCVT